MKKQLFIALACLSMLSCGNPKVGNESVALNTLDSVSNNNQTTLTAATDSTAAIEEVFYNEWDGNPIFPKGGKEDGNVLLNEFITKHISNIEQYSMIKGTIYVMLQITKEGQVKSVSVIRGCNAKLDEEVVKICQGLPTFTPATSDGKPIGVKATFKLPFDGKSFN